MRTIPVKFNPKTLAQMLNEKWPLFPPLSARLVAARIVNMTDKYFAINLTSTNKGNRERSIKRWKFPMVTLSTWIQISLKLMPDGNIEHLDPDKPYAHVHWNIMTFPPTHFKKLKLDFSNLPSPNNPDQSFPYVSRSLWTTIHQSPGYIQTCLGEG